LIFRPNGEDPGKSANDILEQGYVWGGISNKIIATWFDLPSKPPQSPAPFFWLGRVQLVLQGL